MKQFSIPSLAFFTYIIAPAFGDQAVSATGFQGTLNEFTLMDNVVSSRPIIDIRRAQNIMQRRDASCDIVYKNLMSTTNRKITTTEIYGAVKFCKNEFYQGCLKEFRANDPLFGNKILPYFRSAINTDLTTNAYFGDVDRVPANNAAFSTDLFDGIFKWLKKYTTAGVIPAGQTISIANGTDFTATPATAFTVIKGLYDKQPLLMKTFTNDQLAFYVSPELLAGYEDYLVATGAGNTQYIDDIATGRKVPTYKGIRILAEPLWTPVITELKGASGYAAILTVRGNFVFGTDRSYGEDDGSGTDKALIIWYDQEHFTWKYTMFLKAGTQIALPEFVVYALSSWT
jgi:hypothetical protein